MNKVYLVSSGHEHYVKAVFTDKDKALEYVKRLNFIPKPVEDKYYKEWEEVKDVITPGGTPMYICPICKSEESKHLYGLEFMQNRKNRCSHCGRYLKYPGEKR